MHPIVLCGWMGPRGTPSGILAWDTQGLRHVDSFSLRFLFLILILLLIFIRLVGIYFTHPLRKSSASW